MDLDFHIPVSDLRLLASQPIGRRRRPLWPFGNADPDPGRSEFLPGFGPLRKTPASQTGAWEGRAQYVPADRAVRFPDDLATYLRSSIRSRDVPEVSRGDLHLSCLHRWYFGSATAVRSFLELSFQMQDVDPFLNWQQVVATIDSLLAMNVRVGENEKVPLMRASRDVAAYVRRNTTAGHFDGHAPSWLVVGGDVQCVLSLARRPSGVTPLWLSPLGASDERTLLYSRYQDCDVWIVIDSDPVRRKTGRLYLSRLHSERAAFAAILSGLVRSEGDPRAVFTAESPKVRNALDECLDYLDRKRSHGHLQAQLLEALEWDLDVHGDQWDALERHIRELPVPTQARLTRFVNNYDLRGAQGVQIGDSNEMHSHFAEKDTQAGARMETSREGE